MLGGATKLVRMIRVALTPRERLLQATLSNGAVVYGRNRRGHGGRGVYVYRDAIEPELEHLEELLGRTGGEHRSAALQSAALERSKRRNFFTTLRLPRQR
jgi:hypothetical protein